MIYKGENNYIIITINKCKRPTIIRGELVDQGGSEWMVVWEGVWGSYMVPNRRCLN